MDDLISRQAAISAIKEWGLLDGLSEGQAIEILADEEKVPSAQPEHTETHSCDYQRTETHDSRREWYMKGYRDAQRWIPVTEALPDRYIVGVDGKHYSQDVLMTVIHRDDDIFIDYSQMVDDEWYSEMDKEIITSPFEVVAWMHLPECYKGGQE